MLSEKLSRVTKVNMCMVICQKKIVINVIAYAKKKLLANPRECMNFICVCMLNKLHHSIYFHPYLSLIKKLKLGTSVPKNNANTHHMLP